MKSAALTLAVRGLILLCLALPACSLGPASMQSNRLDYNLSAQRSTNEQALLNLVRMRYLETPLFMQVGTIASSYTYSLSGGVTINGNPDSHIFPFGAGVSESPTITYNPYDGQKYTQEILSEIDGQRLILLYRAGINVELLLRCLVDRIGKLDNLSPGRPVDLA